MNLMNLCPSGKSFLFAVVMFLIPAEAVYPAIQELSGVLGEVSGLAGSGQDGSGAAGSPPLGGLEIMPAGDAGAVEELLSGDPLMSGMVSGEELTGQIPDSLLTSHAMPFWRRPAFFLSGGFFALGGLVFAIMGLTGGNSSSGSGASGEPTSGGEPLISGNDGGSGSNPSDDTSDPEVFLPSDGSSGNEDGTNNDGGEGNDNGNSEGVPHTPEPSSGILVGSALLALWLGRRRFLMRRDVS